MTLNPLGRGEPERYANLKCPINVEHREKVTMKMNIMMHLYFVPLASRLTTLAASPSNILGILLDPTSLVRVFLSDQRI